MESFENWSDGWIRHALLGVTPTAAGTSVPAVDVRVQAVSGIGVVKNCVGGIGTPSLSDVPMPRMIKRRLQTVAADDFPGPASSSSWKPDLIIIYLGSNDYTDHVENPTRAQFMEAYANMTDAILNLYNDNTDPVGSGGGSSSSTAARPGVDVVIPVLHMYVRDEQGTAESTAPLFVIPPVCVRVYVRCPCHVSRREPQSITQARPVPVRSCGGQPVPCDYIADVVTQRNRTREVRFCVVGGVVLLIDGDAWRCIGCCAHHYPHQPHGFVLVTVEDAAWTIG